MEQSNHQSTPFTPTHFPITLICDNINSPANAGSIFRLADAFGVSEIIFCGCIADITSSRLKRTARSTVNNTPYHFEEDIEKIIFQQKDKAHRLIGIEITSGSMPINDLKVANSKPISIFIGNEKSGLQQLVISQLDVCCHIAMYGTNSSMNVSHATAIALYEITSKINSHTLDL